MRKVRISRKMVPRANISAFWGSGLLIEFLFRAEDELSEDVDEVWIEEASLGADTDDIGMDVRVRLGGGPDLR